MGLIEKLEQIKTLVENGAGGGGEKKWYEYNGRPSYYPAIPDFEQDYTTYIVCKWGRYGVNGLNLRIYPTTNTTMDIYIDDVFIETKSITSGAGTVFQNVTNYVNFDDLTLKGQDEDEKMFVIKIVSNANISRIDLGDNYSPKYDNIKEIYTNGSNTVLCLQDGRSGIETFYNMNFKNMYSSYAFKLNDSCLQNLFLPKDVIIPIMDAGDILCGKHLRNYNITVKGATVYFEGIKDLDKINFSISDVTNHIYVGRYSTVYNDTIRQININGSFGGDSSTASLTFGISRYMTGKFGREEFLKMANAIEQNTNGNTRTFAIYSGLYNKLTEDDIAILTNKGYTVASSTT